MDAYKEPYLCLWHGIAEAIEAIEQRNYGEAKQVLLKAQQDAEEAYLNAETEEANSV